MKQEVKNRGIRVIWVLLPIMLLFAPATMAEDTIKLECEPRTFHVVPGEPMRLELTVQAKSAASIRLHLPADPLLLLRAVEKLPLKRTEDGVVVYRRVVVWQALEPGTVRMKDISIETQQQKRMFPEVTITVSDPRP